MSSFLALRRRRARSSISSVLKRLRLPSGLLAVEMSPRLTYAYNVGSLTPSRRAASSLSTILMGQMLAIHGTDASPGHLPFGAITGEAVLAVPRCPPFLVPLVI